MSERFYINCPLRPGPVDLPGPEARHLAVVCRLRPGDPVCLFNGDGHEYPAKVLTVDRRHVTVEILTVVSPRRELTFPLVVAAPLPRGDRAQFLLEKLTEIGATSFVPLATKRSVVQPREGRLEKLQRYVIEASKQCGRNVLLRIEPLATWESFCTRTELPGLKIVAHPAAHPDSSSRPFHLPPSSIPNPPAFSMAVGPEGGFTEEEMEMARAAGWLPFHLGPRILRIETGALVLAAWASAGQFHWESAPGGHL